MKLYYHKTDGGAEYYCLKSVKELYGTNCGENEGAMSTAILRVDGEEIELLTQRLKVNNISFKINMEA